MQNAIEIKNRQKSISNIGQMAKAMELVSVTKMRRSQSVALSSRSYAKAAIKILKNVSAKISPSKSYFFGSNLEKDGKTAILLITTDKGLCGGLNANIFKKTEKIIVDLQSDKIDFVVIGKKGFEWSKRKKFNVIKYFFNFGDYIDTEETAPVAEFIINIFKEKKYNKVFAIYTNFITALKQEAVARQILPLKENNLQEIIDGITPAYGKFSETKSENIASEKNRWNFEYKFEPGMEEILDGILYSLVEAAIYYIILENNASEHSARRMAMRNASDSAEEIMRELILTYNKARQAGITQELNEIASAANLN